MTPRAQRLAAIRAQLVRDQADRVEESTRADERAWMSAEIERLERALQTLAGELRAERTERWCGACERGGPDEARRVDALIRKALGEGGGGGSHG